VTSASTAVTLAASANPANFGAAVTFTATVSAVSPAAGTPTGLLTFFDGASPLASLNLDASGVATVVIEILSVGTHAITAAYSGDAHFQGSGSSPMTQVVDHAASASSLTASANPSVFGQPVTFTDTIVAALGTAPATGTVSFFNGATLLGTAALVDGSAN